VVAGRKRTPFCTACLRTPESWQAAGHKLKVVRCHWQAGSVEYIMQPRIDRLSCQTYPIGGTAGPTAQAQRRRLLQSNAAHLGLVRLWERQKGCVCLSTADRCSRAAGLVS
jgi:hypothetical protein